MSGGSGVQKIEVHMADAGIRIDRWFKRHFPEIAFGKLQKMMRKGDIRLDGKRVKGKEQLEVGQIVRVPPISADLQTKPKEAPVKLSENDMKEVRSWVVYKDDEVIVLNKPAGLATQGGTGITRHLDGLLVALKYDYDQRPKLVHRLDKDTSGALLLARTANAAAALAKSFSTRETDKRYFALVVGKPDQREGRIILKMDKIAGKNGERMVVTEKGKHSLTDFEIVDHALQSAAWLTLKPHTGRTHQLRLHCAEIGHPIVGDGKYGGQDAFLTGSISRKLHLHSRFIDFPHPSGGRVRVEAPLPEHMKASFDTLGFTLRDYEDPFDEDNT